MKLFCSSQVTKSSAGLMWELVYSSRIKGAGKWIFQILICVGAVSSKHSTVKVKAGAINQFSRTSRETDFSH